MEIYKVLNDIINERDLTVADIARMCGLPDSTVRGIVTRKQKTVALDVAFKLSDGLGVSLEQLNGLPPGLYQTALDVAYSQVWEKIKADPRKLQAAMWMADLDSETFSRVDQILTAAFER